MSSLNDARRSCAIQMSKCALSERHLVSKNNRNITIFILEKKPSRSPNAVFWDTFPKIKYVPRKNSAQYNYFYYTK
jgi:hypothetical protein